MDLALRPPTHISEEAMIHSITLTRGHSAQAMELKEEMIELECTQTVLTLPLLQSLATIEMTEYINLHHYV